MTLEQKLEYKRQLKVISYLQSCGYRVKTYHKRNFGVDEEFLLDRTCEDYAQEVDLVIRAKGGETRVVIISPDGMEYEGCASCRFSDTYENKLGRMISFERALGMMDVVTSPYPHFKPEEVLG